MQFAVWLLDFEMTLGLVICEVLQCIIFHEETETSKLNLTDQITFGIYL